ncbi:MAG TPA: HypC/HybG/HupF family hydrogenase formation chaperone [Chloroflexota bacterium]|nr:HypC/HybG/HupF family hydrogenase formation chaperone [Chloroflexota bacterium]
MCLAIPGRIVEMVDENLQLAKAEIGGVRRNINIGLVRNGVEQMAIGDWVLIHVGFALSKVDEAEAHSTLKALEEIGAAYRQELFELHESRIE